MFSTPSAAMLHAFEEHGDHTRAMRERGDGVAGVSIQAWNLLSKIVEVRDALTAHSGATVVEAHPECTFREMDPEIGGSRKHSGRGVAVRLRALSRRGLDVDLLRAPDPVPVDDLLDAAALLWTAGRYELDDHITLPREAAADEPTISI